MRRGIIFGLTTSSEYSERSLPLTARCSPPAFRVSCGWVTPYQCVKQPCVSCGAGWPPQPVCPKTLCIMWGDFSMSGPLPVCPKTLCIMWGDFSMSAPLPVCIQILCVRLHDPVVTVSNNPA